MAKNLHGKLHYHACLRCKLRYDDACHTQDIDDVCTSCRRGAESKYQEALKPRECCTEHCTRAYKEDHETYRLRGQGPWWICRKCYRQFGWNPKESWTR